MPVSVTQANYRGFALIDLGRDVGQGAIRLSFQRQGADPRHLGREGWQPEIAWHAADRVTSNAPNTIVRVGPAVVDRIDEHVPIEIVVEGEGSLGIVDWPQLAKSRRGLAELRAGSTPKVAARVEPPRPSLLGRAALQTEPASASQPQSAPEIANAPQPSPAPPAAASRVERKKPRLFGLLLAVLLIAVAIASIPLVISRMGDYDLVVDIHGPLDFVEAAPPAGSARFTPAAAIIEVRRAGWASWFAGWWLTEPPPAAPVIGAPWLTAQVGATNPHVITFIIAPEPRAFPPGVPRLQTTVTFRNTVSASSTEPRTATLQRTPGRLLVEPPGGAIFQGPQGGPFTPPRVAFNLGATGLGFNWSIEGTIPDWLDLTPIQGELRDNGSAQAVVQLRSIAQSLSPGTYDAGLVFKKAGSAEPITRFVRLIVEAQGNFSVDPPTPLVFTGLQGGPFSPPRIPFHLAAVGRGFKWSLEGTIPYWLEATPVRGELGDDGSAMVVVQLRPTAQTLVPGTYDAKLTFQKDGAGEPITRSVSVVVKQSP
jgi:hypothetical protein